MYETNFGFKDRPFTVSPSTACFFQAAEHQNILDELLISISSLNGITILTGDAGTGKTAICRQIIFQLENQFQIQFVEHCNFPTVRALLQTLLYGLTDCYEKVSEQELRLALRAEIRSSFLAHDQPLLVIVDEAHLLNVSFLEELRVLSDISFDGKPALQLMLCGQTALEETLIQSALSSLNQRIGCQVYLDRMTRQESEEYIEYRIKRVATEERSFFTEEAIKFITHVSDGLPRCLNQICDHSLMLAYVQDSPVVDESIAREAFTDLQQLPLHWNDPLPASSPLEELRKGSHSEVKGQAVTDDYEIDSCMEDRLNQLVEADSDEAEFHSDDSDSDWDSSDLLSLGDDIEAIEIGSGSEAIENHEQAASAVESVSEFLPEAEIPAAVSHIPVFVYEEEESAVTTDGFVAIIDRYAAIDAGIDPATLPREPKQKSAVLRQPLQLQPPQFHPAVKSISAERQIAKPQDLVSEQITESHQQTGLSHKPELTKSSELDSVDLPEDHQRQVNEHVFQELAHEISLGGDSFEELLAAQIFEVCAETRKGLFNALNEIRNYTETPETKTPQEDTGSYDMVQPDSEEWYESEAPISRDHSHVLDKLNEQRATSTFRVDSQSGAREQQSATSHLRGPAFGRYKNLFTRIRRKQGLN
ncbi:MAG: AAA family ATPase [Planctomycetota bacterium]